MKYLCTIAGERIYATTISKNPPTYGIYLGRNRKRYEVVKKGKTTWVIYAYSRLTGRRSYLTTIRAKNLKQAIIKYYNR